MRGSTSTKGRLPTDTSQDKLKWRRLVKLVKKMQAQGLSSKTDVDIVEIYNRYKQAKGGKRDYPPSKKSSLKMWQPGRKAYEDRKAGLTRKIK